MFQNNVLEKLEIKKILREARPQTPLRISRLRGSSRPSLVSSHWRRRCLPQYSSNKAIRCNLVENFGAITLTFIFIFLVQKPAPPNITKIVTEHDYARVHYKINTKDSESSYVTNFIVFLNESEDQNVSTRGKFLLPLEPLCTFELNIHDGSLTRRKCTQDREAGFFIFAQLKPNTQYTFEMNTQDGSKQNSRKVTRNFKTDEAGISVKKYTVNLKS